MKTLINIKADREVKEGASKLAHELGFSLSAVINAYLKEFMRSRSVAFSAVPKMSPALVELLAGIEKDITSKKNISKGFVGGKAVLAHLRSIK